MAATIYGKMDLSYKNLERLFIKTNKMLYVCLRRIPF